MSEVGKRYGRLTILSYLPKTPYKGRKCLCRCACGKELSVLVYSLKSKNTRSCGCLRMEMLVKRSRKHGFSPTGHKNRIYNIWVRLRQRCSNKNTSDYKSYGNRGIKVCRQWQDDFKSFHDWAMANGYEDGLQIDRIDNDGDYSPGNCRWATPKMQAQNTRKNRWITYKGQRKTLTEWARFLGVEHSLLKYRLDNWSKEDAFKIPVKKENHNGQYRTNK